MKIKTIIVEDERLARNEMRDMLAVFPQIEIIDEATNVAEGIEKIDAQKPDLIFLDINMPANKTGFDLLEVLDHTPKVIFTTAHDEYAIKDFEVNALDYLLKPIEEERLQEAVEKLEKVMQSEKTNVDDKDKKLSASDKVFVKDGERCWFVKLADVRFF